MRSSANQRIMKMQFSIAAILLGMLAIAASISTVRINGMDSLPLLIPHVLVIALAIHLRRRRKIAVLMAAGLAYLSVWITTVFISPNSIRNRLPVSTNSTAISWRYSSNMYPPIVARGLSIQTQAPWHYCHIKSSPCPLITVVDHGMLDENKSGSGGRTWFLWLGMKSVPVRVSSSWTQ